MICFPTDVKTIATVLPRRPDSLLNALNICFIGNKPPTKDSIKWICQVRSVSLMAIAGIYLLLCCCYAVPE